MNYTARDYLTFTDIQWCWQWIRFKLPKDKCTEPVINIQSVTEKGMSTSDPPFERTWNKNYPIDTSFIGAGEQFSAPCTFEVHGITFLMSWENEWSDVNSFRDSYIYRFWLMQKWYHQGPMRIFPGTVNADELWSSEEIKSYPDTPIFDMWNPPLVIPSGCDINIQLEGNAFVPNKDMDIIIGMVGKYTRGVQ